MLFRRFLLLTAQIGSVLAVIRFIFENCYKTYIWVYRNQSLCGTHPIVLFDWQPSRHSEHPREYLKTFSETGFLLIRLCFSFEYNFSAPQTA
ncbi:IS66 family transposase [Blautia wexlerae]|uniref:IS66 family transposase n=1 Tax=Blautia wexlerae TaxID=418240 RepID=UPI00157079CB|nr:transposase [Blautia wexlerae]